MNFSLRRNIRTFIFRLSVSLIAVLSAGFAIYAIVDSDEAGPIADVIINEVVTSNGNIISDEDNDFSDWIEIHNRSAKEIDLSTYVLARDGDTEWQFPSLTLKPDAYLIIFSSGKNKTTEQLHTNFRLSRSGVMLSLEDRSSRRTSARDVLTVPSLVRNSSFGRDLRNMDRACHFAFPTPGDTNVAECFDDNSLGAPQLSHQTGFYSTGFELTISPGTKDLDLYYTVDGTYPDPLRNPQSTFSYTRPIRIEEQSPITGPLSRIDTTITDPAMNFPLFRRVPPVADDIRPATVIRVRSEFSVETSATFFVGDEFTSTIPVVSLILNPEHLFNHDTGIYIAGATYEQWRNSSDFSPTSRWLTPTNYNRRGREWERPFANNPLDAVRMQLCVASECNETFNVGIRINGNASRIQPMHALRIIAREEYGADQFTQDLFGDGSSGWKSLILRNGGNNYRGYGDRFHFNDAFFQAAMSDMTLATQSFRPMNVYVNGEYWGVHNLRERYDNRYFTVRFGVDENNVATVDSIFTADAPEEIFQEWNKLPERFQQLDLTDNVSIKEIESLIDVESFYDFIIANTFAGNTDWPGNNTRMWRSIQVRNETGTGYEDGRWRWTLLDLDRIGGTITRPDGDDLRVFDRLSSASRLYQPQLLHSLLRFPVLKQRFFDQYEQRLSTILTSDRMTTLLDELAQQVGPEMDKHARRWSLFDQPIGTNTWANRVADVRTFLSERPDLLRSYLGYLRSQW